MSLEWTWVGALERDAPACDRPPVSLRPRGERLQQLRPARKDIATVSGPVYASSCWCRRRFCSGAISRTPGGPGAGRRGIRGLCAFCPEVSYCLSIRSCWPCGSDPRESSADRSGSICAKVATPSALIGTGGRAWELRLPGQRGVRAPDARMGAGLSRSARELRWTVDRSAQRSSFRDLLRPAVLRACGRGLSRLGCRPRRRDRRPDRARRDDRLDRARAGPPGGSLGQVSRSWETTTWSTSPCACSRPWRRLDSSHWKAAG